MQSVTPINAKSSALKFVDTGTPAAYWVTYSTEKNVIVNLLAIRQPKSKITYLSTTARELGAEQWIADLSSDIHHDLLIKFDENENLTYDSTVTRVPHQIEYSKCLEFLEDEETAFRVTERQVDAAWFLLRKFTITSTSAANVLGALIRSNRYRDLDDSDDFPIKDLIAIQSIAHYKSDLILHHSARDHSEDENAAQIHTAALACEKGEYNTDNSEVVELDDILITKEFVMSAKVEGQSGLKAMCERLQLSKSGVKADLQKRLLDKLDKPPLTSEQSVSEFNNSVYKALISSMFLDPSMTTQHMKEGRANEYEVVKHFPDFFKTHKVNHEKLSHFIIREISTTGYMASFENDLIGTSPDALLLMECDDVRNPLRMAALEVKTRMVLGTKNILYALKEEYGELVHCSTKDDAFLKIIPNSRDRIQLIHHAATMKLGYVFYVEAVRCAIVRCVIVRVSSSLIGSHMNIMNYVADHYLPWVKDSKCEIPDFTTNVLGYCADMHSLRQ